MIKPEKWQALKVWMDSLNVQESDLTEKFITGSGRGGQNLQKTASCVYLKHNPSGIEVKCQKARSREDNRFFARRLLCEKIETNVNLEASPQKKQAEKIRKQKLRRKRRTNKNSK